MGIFGFFKNFKKKEIEEKEEVNLYDKGLEKTSEHLSSKIALLNTKYKKVNDNYFDELEEILIMADVGVNTVMKFIDKLKARVKSENITNVEELNEIVVDELFIIYVNNDIIVNKINYSTEGPTVILFVGVNGVGKTTTIGKLAYSLKEKGKKVLMVAGDTFRAGAVEQIKEWGERIDVPVVLKENADPASVVYDGLCYMRFQRIEVTIPCCNVYCQFN